MLEKVKKYIIENNLIEAGDRIIVGVSGGADSVCLFFMLYELRKELDFEITVVHINHGIRGKEALEDASFVEKLAKGKKIQSHILEFNIPAIAKERGISVEEAGREIRYESFRRVALETGANKIAVAHNSNDSVETVLLSLFRGTGIKGLTGIMPNRNEIIRPLLCMKRKEIEDYLDEKGIIFRNDSTNFQDIYARNKIRNSIIPEIKKDINAGVEDNILGTARQLDEIENFLEKLTREKYKGSSLLVRELEELDIVLQKRIVRKAIEEKAGRLKDITSVHINEVLSLKDKEVGKIQHLPYGLEAVRTYDSVDIYERSARPVEESVMVKLEVPGEYFLDNEKGTLKISVIKREEIQENEEKIYTKYLDYDKIKDTLYLRNRRTGDYFKINQDGNTKKIKSYFIDEKIPLKDRNKILLIAQGDHVLWIIGYRISEEFKVSDETKRVIKFEFSRG